MPRKSGYHMRNFRVFLDGGYRDYRAKNEETLSRRIFGRSGGLQTVPESNRQYGKIIHNDGQGNQVVVRYADYGPSENARMSKKRWR